MGGQEELFPPASRRTDPATSHQAEAELENVRGSKMLDALVLLRRHPGSTAKELECRGYSEGVRKRLNDLRVKGRARVGPPRTCKVSGKKAQTWYPVV